MNLALIQKDILELSPDAEPAALLAVLDRVKAAKERLKEIDQLMEARAIEIINARGSFRAGDTLYSVGYDRRTKCIDPKSLLSVLLEATEGDLDRVAGCLASDAWKCGASRQTLEEHGRSGEYDRHFETVEIPKLKLKAIDTKFIKSKAVSHG